MHSRTLVIRMTANCFRYTIIIYTLKTYMCGCPTWAIHQVGRSPPRSSVLTLPTYDRGPNNSGGKFGRDIPAGCAMGGTESQL